MKSNNHDDVDASQAVLELPARTPPREAEVTDQSLEVPPIEVPESFTIDDVEKASWAVRKIVEARQYAERVRQWAEGELRRAEHEEQWLLRRFGAELEMWTHQDLKRRGGSRRSVNLPGGTLGFRLQPRRLEVTDELQLIAWCRENLPAAVRTQVEAEGVMGLRLLKWQQQRTADTRLRERLLREIVSRHLSDTGEVPDGATVGDEVDRFYVK